MEFATIKERVVADARERRAGWSDLRTSWIRRIVTFGFGLAALTVTIANGVVAVLAVSTGMYLLGRYGRRPMLLTGQIGVTVSLVLMRSASWSCPSRPHAATSCSRRR